MKGGIASARRESEDLRSILRAVYQKGGGRGLHIRGEERTGWFIVRRQMSEDSGSAGDMSLLCLGILASGSGTNLQAIIDSVERGDVPARVGVVVSDIAGAQALERAKRHDIPHFHVDPEAFSSKESYEAALLSILGREGVELVVLAGYLRLVGKGLLTAYPGRILNIHPSLLPAFPGLGAVGQAIGYGVKVTGVTVHIVDEGLDTGPVILQEAVEVREGDTEETLLERLHIVEHRLYPEAIRLIAENRLVLEGRRVSILPPGERVKTNPGSATPTAARN